MNLIWVWESTVKNKRDYNSKFEKINRKLFLEKDIKNVAMFFFSCENVKKENKKGVNKKIT